MSTVSPTLMRHPERSEGSHIGVIEYAINRQRANLDSEVPHIRSG